MIVYVCMIRKSVPIHDDDQDDENESALIVHAANARFVEVLRVRLQPKVDNALREVLRIQMAGSADLEVDRVEWRMRER